jgi:N-acyl-D-amino-acid deacylase
MRTVYQQPWVMVSSDGGIGMRHPRATGTFPRVLGRFVREEKYDLALRIPEMHRRRWMLACSRFVGFFYRGTIASGLANRSLRVKRRIAHLFVILRVK